MLRLLWRTAREALGVPEVTTHSFRNTVADLIDAEGCQPASVPTSSGTAMCR